MLRYYARRFGAILLSYYASTLLMLLFAILACQSGSCIGGTEALGPFSMVLKTVLTFLMLQSFDPLEPSFPNGPAWTISTMGLMWLLYPQLLAWLRLPLARRPFLVAACAALCCQLPMVLCFFAGAVAPQSGLRAYFISETQSLIGYHFPPLRVADFVLGMALAQALADGRAAQDNMRWALVADLTLLAVWGVCGWVPWDARSADFPVSGYEPLFIGGMQPFIGARRRCRGRRPCVARARARPPMHLPRTLIASVSPSDPHAPRPAPARRRPAVTSPHRPFHVRLVLRGRLPLGVCARAAPPRSSEPWRIFVPGLFMALANRPHLQGAARPAGAAGCARWGTHAAACTGSAALGCAPARAPR